MLVQTALKSLQTAKLNAINISDNSVQMSDITDICMVRCSQQFQPLQLSLLLFSQI